MNIYLSLMMMLTFLFQQAPMDENQMKKQVYGSYCVMSMNDATILDAQNKEHTQSVASISKVMSAIVAIEAGGVDEFVTVDESIDTAYGSMLYIKKGEVYTLKDLIYGLMLRSGNDAALQIATFVGGDVPSFVKMMNEKAKELHMDQTLFRNPSGLDEEDGGNISSSCDMALLMRYAMQNKTFREIVGSTSYSPRKGVLWRNKNRFLKSYAYATGGKTGFTTNARRTLITTSKKDNMEVVVVTLNVSDDYTMHETLHEYAYNNYDVVQIVKKGKYLIQGKKYAIDEIAQTTSKEDKKIQYRFNLNDDILHIHTKYKDIEREYRYE